MPTVPLSANLVTPTTKPKSFGNKVQNLAAVNDHRSLQSTWSHRAWVAAGTGSLIVSFSKFVYGAFSTGHFLVPTVTAFIGYLVADLCTGIYHWGIDNYGDASTPMFGAQIEASQGHHRFPWIITRRQFANNLHALARAVALAVIPFDLATDDPAVHAFVTTCGGCLMLSQQFHAWAHGPKSRLPSAVVALQDAGVILSPEMHGYRHRPPFNGNYCVMCGIWNKLLDRSKVFFAAEMALFFTFGVRPRSWSELQEEGWREAQATPS